MSQDFNMVETAFRVVKFFIPFLFALCFHEFAHGVVALWRGDRTAQMMGRLTLNPLAHADPLGTFFLPILSLITAVPLFGWAKPVPVDERNLKNPRADMFWIAAAGPLSNLLLAFVASFATAFFIKFNMAALGAEELGATTIVEILKMFVMVNVYLAVFNLIPLHPLDGGKVIARFLPHEVNRKLEDMQQITSFILLALFMTGAIAVIAFPAQWIAHQFMLLAAGVAGL
jgi:Zn-dependent protease